MAKKTKASVSLQKSWINNLKEEEKHDFKIEGGGIFCRPCNRLYHWTKVSQFTQHRETENHARHCQIQRKSRLHQTVLTETKRSEFNEDLCKAFLAADIPLKKLKNPVFSGFLEKYCEKPIPDESTIRKSYIPIVHAEVIRKIQMEVADRKVFIQVDETTDKTGRFVANVIVGALSKEGSTTPHLLMVKQLEATNNASVTQLILDALKLLFPTLNQAEVATRFQVMLTDAAPYMVKAGKNLKMVYPELIHVTCVAHGLHRIAECIRTTFKTADQFLANTKAIFKKAPSRVRKYKEMYPDLQLPPEPILTRWGTWLDAADFVGKNFDAIRTVILSLDEEEAECIKKAKSLLQDPEVSGQFAELLVNFTFISEVIKKFESRSLSLVESFDLLEETKSRLQAITSTKKDKILAKLNNVLDKNPDLKKLSKIAQIISGREVNVDLNLNPETLASLAFCPVTSVEVERSFSMAKALLDSRRLNFTMNNYEMCLVCHYELGEDQK